MRYGLGAGAYSRLLGESLLPHYECNFFPEDRSCLDSISYYNRVKD